MVPLMICMTASLNKILLNNHHFWSKRLITFVFILLWVKAIYYGLPQELYNVRYNWDRIDYEKVENFVKSNVKEEDVIYADFATFYAIKPRVKKVFFPLYYNRLSKEDKESLSAIIIDPRERVREPWNPGFVELVGEEEKQWYDTGKNLDTGVYHLKIYRKKI